MMNRIPFMKAPTTAQTNNDSLFLNRNVASAPAKDPTLQTIEEEIGKISLQHRQFKNETIEEIDSRIRRYGLEMKTATSNLQNAAETIQRGLAVKPQEPINLDGLKQELLALLKEAKPAEDGSTNLKELIGKNMNGMRQDINRLREATPVYPNYDKELAELKQTVDALRVHVTGSTASKNDVNSLFSIVGSMKTPLDELRRTLASTDFSSFPKTTPTVTLTAKEVADAIAKNNKEIGDMVGKSVNNVQKPIFDKMDSNGRATKELMDSQQRFIKEMIETHQRSLLQNISQSISANKPAENLSALLDSKLNSFFDRIKNEIVIKMAERLDEVLMQTRKLENYFVESRSQFSDSMRTVTKKIDETFLDKDTKEIIVSSINDFMAKNKPQIVEGVSNHITEDMIVILRELKERNSAIKTESVEPKPEAKVVQKANPFSPFKKG